MVRNSPLGNHGQVLVLFIMLLPAILLGIYALFSYFTLKYEEKNLNHIAEITCQYALTGKDEEEIEKLVHKNDKGVKIESIEGNVLNKSVTLKKEVDTLFLNYKTTVLVSVECSR